MSLDLERIRSSTRRVAKFVKRNSKRPAPEAVHKLRTSARRLETVLTAVGLDSRRGADALLRVDVGLIIGQEKERVVIKQVFDDGAKEIGVALAERAAGDEVDHFAQDSVLLVKIA